MSLIGGSEIDESGRRCSCPSGAKDRGRFGSVVFIRDGDGHGDGGEGGVAIDGEVQSGSGAVVAAPKIEGDPFWTRLFVVADPLRTSTTNKT